MRTDELRENRRDEGRGRRGGWLRCRTAGACGGAAAAPAAPLLLLILLLRPNVGAQFIVPLSGRQRRWRETNFQGLEGIVRAWRVER